MDILFSELLDKTKSLHTIGEAALNGPLSTRGERDRLSGFLPTAKQNWARYVGEIKEKQELLEHTIHNVKTFEHSKEVSQRLAYFRTLPRRLSEGGDPMWSGYYDNIDTIMDHIHLLLLRIDSKYKLGQHKNDP